MKTIRRVTLVSLLVAAAAQPDSRILNKENLVAWCIVPFDAKKRGPEDRAEMLERLGLHRLAYDWREQHIPEFDAEIDALARRHIRLEAFWATVSEDSAKNKHLPVIFDLLQRRHVSPQIWLMFTPSSDFNTVSQEQKVKRAAATIRPVALEAAKVGSQVALYNHGGWFGEPENQIAVLREMGLKNTGIVYNFHHGRAHMDRFPELLRMMQPYLLAINLNGMQADAPMILPIGDGDRETEMIRVLAASGWKGPVGILNHQENVDAEVGLRRNLEGLERVKARLSQH